MTLLSRACGGGRRRRGIQAPSNREGAKRKKVKEVKEGRKEGKEGQRDECEKKFICRQSLLSVSLFSLSLALTPHTHTHTYLEDVVKIEGMDAKDPF